MGLFLKNPKPVTEQQFGIYPQFTNWTTYEIPQPYWGQMSFLPRIHDAVGIYGSGIQVPSGFSDPIAGFDVLAFEPKPKLWSKSGPEPPLNIYHLLVTKLLQPQHGYSYLCYGPYTFGALQDHWPRDPEAAIKFYTHFDKHVDWTH
jgi:hypothetical protein